MPYPNMLNILARGVQTKPTWDYMDSRMNALKSLGMEQDIQMQPQRMAMEQERLGLAREQLGVSKGHLGISQGQFDLDKQRFSAGKEAKEAAKRDMLFQRIQEYPESVSLETWDELLNDIPEKYRKDIPTAKEWMESMGRSGMLAEGADPNEIFKKQILPRYIGKTQQMKERKLQADEMEARAKETTANREGRSEKYTVDNVLAEKVINGEITLEEAMGLKKKADEENTEWKLFMAEGLRQGKTKDFLLGEWNDRLMKRSMVVKLTPTSEGLVPFIERGKGVGTTGEPTGLMRPIPPEQASKIGEIETLLKNIERVESIYNPAWVGPVAGRVGEFKEKYTGGAISDQVTFYAYVRDMKDAILRARSGAQINEQEYKRLEAFLPSENLPPNTFKSRLLRFKESLNTVLAEKKRSLGDAGYGYKQTGGSKQEKTKTIGRFKIEVE